MWLTTDWILAHCGQTMRAAQEHYRQCGYRLREIAERLGVHEVTVSRRLKRAEQGPV